MSKPLEFITVDTAESPNSAVIWMHGLGADCHDFEGIVPQLGLQGKAIRFVFPNAPIRPVTINGGMEMRAWYDILEMTLDRKVDMANIKESVEQIEQIISELDAQGIASDKVVIAGFSQGGVIAYQVALCGQYQLAGVMALSTYIADPDQVQGAQGHKNEKTPFLIQHGTLDPVVDPSLAVRANTLLNDKGYVTEYSTFPMPHSVCAEQVAVIGEWLNQRFA